jgi:hypothetical protein
LTAELPREYLENDEQMQIRSTLKDAIRTTRKFGLGWMFISQTLSGLDREIINQLRVSISLALDWHTG